MSSSVIVERAAVPELIDIKLTDYCPFNCEFCYMDSTVRGKHGNTEELLWLASYLSSLEVMEVALGGGDPTLHPDFIQIVDTFNRAKIVTNFTTKNLAWLRNPKQWIPIVRSTGGFAFSATKPEEIEELSALVKTIAIKEINKDYQITIQHVVGTDYCIDNILDSAKRNNFTVTLLGYKTVGRGPSFEPKIKADEAFEMIKEYLKQHKWLRIGIDTLLAQQWKKELKKYSPDSLYTLEEGKFSMYIDAVTGLAGPSSYCDPKLMQPYKYSHYKNGREGKDLLEIFEGFQSEESNNE